MLNDWTLNMWKFIRLVGLIIASVAIGLPYHNTLAVSPGCAEINGLTRSYPITDDPAFIGISGFIFQAGDTLTVDLIVTAGTPVTGNFQIMVFPPGLVAGPTAMPGSLSYTIPATRVYGDVAVYIVPDLSGLAFDFTITCEPSTLSPVSLGEEFASGITLPPGINTGGASALIVPISATGEEAGEDYVGLSFWGINDEGDGYPAFYVSKESLDALPENPESNLEIARTDNGQIVFYKLTTGEYQVNIGPDSEGKVQVIIFDGIPATNIYRRDFNVNDPPIP
jgi:hypothetical protein